MKILVLVVKKIKLNFTFCIFRGHYFQAEQTEPAAEVLHVTFVTATSIVFVLYFCIFTQRNISMYYRTQSAIRPIRLHKYSPTVKLLTFP